MGDFWLQAKPGDTLCLEDGTYRGAASMISPPRGLNGSPGNPITIRALNDGMVLVDGEGKYLPVHLFRNQWFVIQGLNACCSGSTVVAVSSSHDVIRRVTAWDAAEGNNDIFGIHYGDHNLLEDVAGWGIARKIFESSQGGNFTTIRRAWGRWEGSHVVGPKMVYTLAYNNYDMLVENAIGTWSGERMKQTYVLLDSSRKPWVGRGAGTYQNHEVNQPYAVFGVDRLDGDPSARSRLLGSLAYVKTQDSFSAPYLVFVTKVDSVQIADTVGYIEPGSYPHVKTFGLFGAGGSIGLSARNLTSVGGAGANIGKGWETHNVADGASSADHEPGIDVFNSSKGATLCHRYIDGSLSDQPLWPWPMNKRILDATRQSGRAPVDVTATVEGLFGPIPRQCRSDVAQSVSESDPRPK